MKTLPPARPHGPRHLAPARLRASLGAVLGLGFLLPSPLSAAEVARRTFDSPAGDATATLKQFATQSNTQLLYNPDEVRGIQTHAVHGEFSSFAALTHMLQRTPLKARQDEKTNAIAVTVRPPSHAPPSPDAKQRLPSIPRTSSPQTNDSPSMKKRSVISFLASLLTLGLSGKPSQPQPPQDPVSFQLLAASNPQGGADGAPARAGAQQTGVITGKISNQATKAYLEGARVVLHPSGLSTLTGLDGSYTFLQVPAGAQTLSVSYTGLDPQTISATVDAGQVLVQDIALTSAIYVLDAVVVPGEREGNALAITQQRNAPNVKNVLSSDAFGNVADENIGNFLLRVPGIASSEQEGEVTGLKIRGVGSDLNSVTVDGTRSADGGTRTGLNRGMGIDTIPAGFVDKIEVIKAPTPDMDADSIGGSVNLRTKSALNQKGRVISYRAGASYDTGRKTFRPQGSLMYSDVFGPNRNLGVLINANFSWTSNPHDVIFGAWEPTLETSRPAWFALTTGGEDIFERKRGGLGVRFDYKWNDNSTAYVNFMGSQNHDRLFRRRNSFSAPTTSTVVPGWTAFVTETRNTTYGLDQVDRTRDVRTYNIHLGGEQKLFGAKLDYNFNFSPSKGYEKRVNINPTVAGVGFRFDRGATIHEPAGATFVQISGPDITNPANMTFGSLGFTDVKKEDRMIGGQINVHKEIALAVPAFIQTGVRFRAQTPKSLSAPTTYNYVGPGGAALARFMDQYYVYQPEALRGTMPNVRFIHSPTVVYEWETKPAYFTTNNVTSLRNQLVADRNASEAVYAAYLMGHARFGRLGVLAGLRVEETRVEGTGTFQFISPAEKARRAAWLGTVTEAENLRRTQAEYGNRVTNKSSYRNLFPGLHFRYEFARGIQARASYSTGIGRPNFGTIIPNNSVNETTRVVTANNTGLKPQWADNFDAALEYYFEPAGLLSAGVFLKEIKNFIFSTDTGTIGTGLDNGFGGDYGGYRLNTQSNGGFARIRGLELNYQQQFTNLPGFWRGFGLYVNHTWLEAIGDYGTIGSTLRTGQVPGFVPRMGNVGLSYIDHGWMVRIQENFVSRALAGSVNANPALQQYIYGAKRVNLNVSYRLTSRFNLFADVINLFGESGLAGNIYIYVPGRKRGADSDDPEIKCGVSGRF